MCRDIHQVFSCITAIILTYYCTLSQQHYIKSQFLTSERIFTTSDTMKDLFHNVFDDCAIAVVRDCKVPEFQTVQVMKLLENHSPGVLYLTADDIEKSSPTQWDPYVMTRGRNKAYNCVLNIIIGSNKKSLSQLLIRLESYLYVPRATDYFMFQLSDMSGGQDIIKETPIGFTHKFSMEIILNESSIVWLPEKIYDGYKTVVKYLNVTEARNVREEILNPKRNLIGTGWHVEIYYLKEIKMKDVWNKVANEGIPSLEVIEALVYTFFNYYNNSWNVYTVDNAGQEALESRLPNGSWVGSVSELLSGKAHGSLVLFWSEGVGDFVDQAYPCAFMDISAVVKKPSSIASWYSAAWPYTPTMWILIVATMIFSSVIMHLLLKADSNLACADLNRRYSYWLSLCIRYFVNQACREEPVHVNANGIRIFIIFYGLFILIVSGAYQEMLLSFLTIPIKEIIPQSFQDIKDMNYKAQIVYDHYLYFKAISQYAESPLIKYYRNNVETVHTLTECMENSLYLPKHSCGTTSFFLDVEITKYLDENGESQFFYIRKGLLNMYIGTAISRNIPFIRNMNVYSFALLEGGLMYKYNDNNQYYSFFKTIVKMRKSNLLEPHSDVELLNFKHLCGPFAFLAFGIIGSGLVCLGEWLFQRATSQQSNKNRKMEVKSDKIKGEEQQHKSCGSNCYVSALPLHKNSDGSIVEDLQQSVETIDIEDLEVEERCSSKMNEVEISESK